MLNANPWFLFACIIGSVWFIIGPNLVYGFIKYFIDIMNSFNDETITKHMIDKHTFYYIKYKRLLVCFSVSACVVILGLVIFYPYILTNSISNGFRDGLFWVIILFLIHFLTYCCNALALSLLTIYVVKDLLSNNVIKYDPNIYKSRLDLDKINVLAKKTIKYYCSGLLFLPLMWFYLFVLEDNICKLWISIIILLYGLFLLLVVLKPNRLLNKYKKNIILSAIEHEEMLYINCFAQFEKDRQVLDKINFKVQSIDRLLHINYLKSIYRSWNKGYDYKIALFSAVMAMLSVIPAYLDIIKKWM